MVKIMSNCLTRGKVAKNILLVLVLFILILTISPQNVLAEENRQVINASEILDKIEEGKLVAEENCTIIGNLDLSKINLSTIKLDGRELRRVNNSFSIKNSIIRGNVNFNDIYFSGPVNFYDGTNLTGGANFEKSVFSRSANFRNTVFSCEADFSSAAFKGSTYFNGVHFADIANFDYATFKRLSYFNNVCFNDEARFDDAKFYDEVEFNNVVFKSVAAFRWSEFYNETQFNNATFNEDAQFDKARFKDKVEFKNYTKFNETASFRDATFTMLADFEDAQFSKKADFTDTEFNDDAKFKRATFNGYANFTDVTFNKAYFEGATFTKIDFRYVDFEIIEISWSQLEGKLIYSGRLYQALIKNFKALEQFEDADDAYYEYRKIKQSQKEWGDYTKYTDAFSKYICGYGVKPLRPLLSGIVIILVFSLGYYQTGAIKQTCSKVFPKTKNRCWKLVDNHFLKNHKRYKNALYFSASTFIALSYGDWYPTTKFLEIRKVGICRFRTIAIIEALLGWIVMVLFVISLTMMWIR
jgi:uncharacterized protein YjbI with pentapeptide repeats